MPTVVLIAEDDADVRGVLARIASSLGFQVVEAEDGLAAWEQLQRSPADVMLVDLKMPKLDGLELIEKAKGLYPKMPIVMITAHATVEVAVAAMKKGAFDFVTKPFDPDELKAILRKAAEYKKREDAEISAIASLDEERRIVGESPKLLEVLETVEQIAKTDATVLICGETGTGKDLIARAIHKASGRKGAFVKVHCAAIPAHLFESELFGHEKGAFTGATTSKPGRFELASGGTIFLDEVSTLPLEVQPKLLRVLQDREFERVGGIRTIRTDARVIAATNVDLKEMVDRGEFREDLYFRLNVFPIVVPPLRERKEDIPVLARYFGEHYGARLGVGFGGISAEAMDALVAYSWPGNVRELENVIERAVILAKGAEIGVEHLPPEITGGGPRDEGKAPADLKERSKQAQQQFERAAIEEALRETKGNISHAAKRLGLSRRGLQLKIKELGIEVERFKG